MLADSPAAKTSEALNNLRVAITTDYLKKFFEFLEKTEITMHIFGDIFKLPGLDNAVVRIVELLSQNLIGKKKIMVIGNGGSAGIAMHALADYANAGGLKTIDFYGPALLTCMANDYGYENVFVKPIEMFAEQGDMLFAISSSGKSSNIVDAAKTAVALGCTVVTFSGFGADNPLRTTGHINFYTPSSHYGFVELSHQTLIHCILDLYCQHKCQHKVSQESRGIIC